MSGVREVRVTDDLGPAAGQELVEGLRRAVAARGRATLALSGGSAPVPVLQWLVTGMSPDLARATTLTWIDERHVPQAGPDWRSWSPDSNRRLAWEHWLSKVEARPAEVPLDADGPLEEARQRVEWQFVRQVRRVDVALLGVGPDGHVASLFPGRPEIEAQGPVLAVRDSPKPPPERLTLSRPVLEDCDLVVLVATGAAKAPVLARAASGDRAVPLGRLDPGGRVVWVLDREAASGL